MTGDSLTQLSKTNEAFNEHLLNIVMKEAIEPTATFVETMAKALAPKRTGLLADSIRQKRGKGKTKRSIKVGPN